MTEQEMDDWLAYMKRAYCSVVVTGEGAIFRDEKSARDNCELHDKDLVQIGNGWLAKNRETRTGRMPTVQGDVVLHHLGQHFLVWQITKEDAQTGCGDAAPFDSRGRSEAEAEAKRLVTKTNGRLFWLQNNGYWAEVTL